MNEIKDRIRQFILAAHLPGESAESLRDETPLQTSGILDSLATMGLARPLAVYDTSIERFNTIEQIAAVVLRKRHPATQAIEGPGA